MSNPLEIWTSETELTINLLRTEQKAVLFKQQKET